MSHLKLSFCTPQDIQTFLDRTLSKYNHDPDYCIKMTVEERQHDFTIHYSWFPGKPKQPADPTMSLDDYEPLKSWFRVHKNDSFRKLTKEIMDAIDQVVSVPFNPVMERE